MKNIIFIFFSILLFIACKKTDNKTTDLTESDKNTYTLPSCGDIKKYPAAFSYTSENEKDKLLANLKNPLSAAERFMLFNIQNKNIYVPIEFFDSSYAHLNDYELFPVKKISFQTASAIIYLLKLKNEPTSENDQLAVVLYNKDGMPFDILYNILEDAYGSTYETIFTNSDKITIINTDKEYSPDAESEAEDIANGRVIEPITSTKLFRIDTLNLKFEAL